jgi:tetratricopeptide (TPR) repeat protein
MSRDLTEIRELRARCDYWAALQLAQKSVSEGSRDPAVFAESARLLEEFGHYAAADQELQEALCRLDSTPRTQASERHRIRLQAALLKLRRSQGRQPEAIAIAADLVALIRVTLREADAARCAPLVAVGWLRLEIDDFKGARSVIQQARHTATEAPEGADQAFGAMTALAAEGALERACGNYAASEHLLTEALRAAEEICGSRSLEVADILNELGILYKFSARFRDAEPVYLRALDIWKSAVGAEAPDVASVYHNLGGLHHAAGEYARGEPYALKAVEIRQKALGANHVAVAADKAAYAAIVHQLGRSGDAEAYFRSALQIFEQTLGPEHHEIAVNLNNLGAVLQQRGQFVEAEAHYNRALEIKQQSLGGEHPSLATTLNNLGVVLRDQGRVDEAKELFARAIGLLGGVVSPQHPALRAATKNYAALQGLSGREGLEVGPLDARPSSPGNEGPPNRRGRRWLRHE